MVGVEIAWEEIEDAKKKKDKRMQEIISYILFIGLCFPIMYKAPSVIWAVWLTVANAIISGMAAIMIFMLYKSVSKKL